MGQLFNTILYTPLFNFLVFLYNTIAFKDFGIAIILLTLIIRFFLSPLSIKAFKSQKLLADLQPKIKELQEKFKGDPQSQTKEMMEFYKKHKINPFSGCFLLLIQLPILIALYRISTFGFDKDSLAIVYSFIKKPEFLNPVAFGIIDLTKKNFILAIIAGITQFFQTKLSLKNQPQEKNKNTTPLSLINQQMLYFSPFLTIMISISFPAGLPLYWITTTLFSILEQFYINRLWKNK